MRLCIFIMMPFAGIADITAQYSQPSVVGVADDRYGPAIAAGRTFLDSLIATLQLPGLSVAVATNGAVVWSESRGFADVENRRPLSPDTPLRIHSVSKTLTASLLMQLAYQDRLHLDSSVHHYVPTFPVKRWPITLRQLAAHTGGIRHYRSDEEVHNTRRFRTVVESMEPFADDSLVVEPGTQFSYSSYGYNLLGAAIAAACGTAFVECLERRVIVPLGLTSTFADGVSAPTVAEAAYYERTGAALEPATDMDLSNRWPAGGIVSTPTDLVRFGIALLNDELLDSAATAEMFTPHTTNTGTQLPYGMGWSIGRAPDESLMAFHQGGSTGGMSFIAIIPKHGFVFAALANVNGELGDSPPPVELAARALRLFLMPNPAPGRR